jgi:hypothetical protein
MTRLLRWYLRLAAVLWSTGSDAGEPQPPVDVSSVADRDRITTARVDRSGMTSRGVR